MDHINRLVRGQDLRVGGLQSVLFRVPVVVVVDQTSVADGLRRRRRLAIRLVDIGQQDEVARRMHVFPADDRPVDHSRRVASLLEDPVDDYQLRYG